VQVGLVWTVTLAVVLRRHATRVADALCRSTGNTSSGGGVGATATGEQLKAPRLWSAVLGVSTAMLGLLYVYQLSLFQSGYGAL
jgi:hypothetical protein